MVIKTALVASLVSRNVKPSHAHDCVCCTFLGSLDGQDIYVCEGSESIIARFGMNGAYGCVSFKDARRFHNGDGSIYSFALALWSRFRAGSPRTVRPNAYRSPDGRFTRKGGTCGGCEDCDGEDLCDAERIALARAESRLAIDDYSCSIG